MINAIEHMLMVKDILADLADNKEIPTEVRAQAWGFEIILKDNVRKLKCAHLTTVKKSVKTHDSTNYTIETCCDCGMLINQERD
jgi:hypothetical protein